MLVFLGTQDMVDYYAELLSSIFGTSKEDVPLSEGLSYFLNCGIELFKLHGNMKQSERTEVFKTFRESQFGVLLCTVSIFYFHFDLLSDALAIGVFQSNQLKALSLLTNTYYCNVHREARIHDRFKSHATQNV